MGRSETLISIQVLRAIAALSVVAWHLASEVNSSQSITFPEVFLGQSGVDLFFVISGFVMVHSSASLFGKPGGPTIFFSRRVIRIAPLYLAVSSVLLAHAILRHADLQNADLSWGTLISSFLFVPYPRPSGEWSPLHKVGWTLNYEMFFYVVFAASLAFRRTVGITFVVVVIFVLAIVTLIAWPSANTLATWPNSIIGEFAFGVLIGVSRSKGLRLSGATSIAMASTGAAILFGIHASGISSPRVLCWGIPIALVVASAALSRTDLTNVFWLGLAKIGDERPYL